MKYRIMIETTNICNASCPFCSNHLLKRKKMIMSNDIFEIIIRRIIEEKIDIEKFILHLNGEHFTDPNLIERVSRLKKTFPEALISFTTNLSLASKDTIDQIFMCGLDAITVSLNAIDEKQYNEIMGLDYKNTMMKLDYLIERNSELNKKLNISVSLVEKGNKEDVDIFVDKYKNKADVRILHMGNWIGSDNEVEYIGNRVIVSKNSCADLNEQICILSNGDFAICCFDSEGSVGLNVKNHSLLAAFNSKTYTDLRKKLSMNGTKGTICETCSFSYS